MRWCLLAGPDEQPKAFQTGRWWADRLARKCLVKGSTGRKTRLYPKCELTAVIKWGALRASSLLPHSFLSSFPCAFLPFPQVLLRWLHTGDASLWWPPPSAGEKVSVSRGAAALGTRKPSVTQSRCSLCLVCDLACGDQGAGRYQNIS